MTTAERYPIPAARHRAEQTIERSRFICTIERVKDPEDAQAFIREMNAEYADASHNCWAFLAGPPGSTNRIGMSDDGEPHGTAGRPMLTVLTHSGVGEIAAVVTRYFGGTKLGTGGLVKAYGGAVQHALLTLPKKDRVDRVGVELTISYAHLSPIQQLLPAFEAEITGQRFESDVVLSLRLPTSSLVSLRAAVADASRGEAHLSDAVHVDA
ncbi:YigZ family protein [soil metagenome]